MARHIKCGCWLLYILSASCLFQKQAEPIASVVQLCPWLYWTLVFPRSTACQLTPAAACAAGPAAHPYRAL
jgi:hypothetical protein